MWFEEQAAAQLPQLFRSKLKFVSQPFDPMLPSQSPHPSTHVPVQVPAVQALFAT